MSTENLKELRNALSCWQDDYDCNDDKEQYDMFGAAIDAVSRLEAAEKLAEFRLKSINSMDVLVSGRNNRIAELESWGRAVEESMISASDRAEAAERERDELRAEVSRLKDEEHKSGMLRVRVSKQIDALKEQLAEAEAEIARRDAAAGERVATHLIYSSVLPKFIGDTDEVESYSCFISGKTPPRKTMEEAYADAYQVCGPLYSAAPPAVLPPKLSMDINPDLQGEFRVHEAIRRKGFNQALDAALELGAQPQKPVVLPEPERQREPGIVVGIYESFVVYKALDAANVKWEVKK